MELPALSGVEGAPNEIEGPALGNVKGPQISIILVTWNSAPYLRRCLEGIRQQTYARRELIVVDNGSTDGSVDLAGADAAQIIRNETNRGFSAAVNQALGLARGELVLFVNPDCYLTPEYIERLADALHEAGPDFGSATGLLLRGLGWDIEPTNEVDSMGICMTRSGRHFDLDGPRGAERSAGEKQLAVGRRQSAGEAVDGADASTSRLSTADRRPPTADRRSAAALPLGCFEVFGVSGAAAMHRRAFLRDVAVDGEVLDEDFFAYREDADLSWRGRVMGWRALCEPRAIAYHVRRVTPEVRRTLSAEINMHSVKNRFLLRIKNEGAYLALRNAPFELARDLVVLAATLTVERSSLPAFAWLWRNRARVLAKRRAIQRRRRVGDRQLARWFS